MAKALARGEVRIGIREPGIAATWRLRSDKGVAHESRHLDDNQTYWPYVGREHPEEARGAGCGGGQTGGKAASGVKGSSVSNSLRSCKFQQKPTILHLEENTELWRQTCSTETGDYRSGPTPVCAHNESSRSIPQSRDSSKRGTVRPRFQRNRGRVEAGLWSIPASACG